jgi:para-aminobenzoate synthetase component II
VTVRILVVDNYDSFVHTQVGYLRELGSRVDVVRNDAVGAEAVDGYDGVLLSPGPGRPGDAGICVAAVRRCAERAIPLLGVCLGHQALAEAFGARVTHAPELLHGKTSLVVHDGTGVLAGLPSPFTGTRYHSLAVVEDTLPASLRVTARTPGGVVMAVEALGAPLAGVQFHPESVLTEGGHRLLANWLAACGDPGAVAAAEGLSPLLAAGPA